MLLELSRVANCPLQEFAPTFFCCIQASGLFWTVRVILVEPSCELENSPRNGHAKLQKPIVIRDYVSARVPRMEYLRCEGGLVSVERFFAAAAEPIKL